MEVKLTYVNGAGSSVSFYTARQNSKHPSYVLSEISGMGGANVEYDRIALTGNDGSYFGDARFAARGISTTCHVYGATDADRDARLRELNSVLNPRLGDGTVIYQNHEQEYRIGARCRVLPSFLPNTKAGRWKPVIIEYDCAYPHFYGSNEYSQVLASSSRSFKLPFKFPIYLGHLTYAVTCNNQSAVEVPVKIIVKGPATSPRITNTTTRQSLKVRRELAEGEVLTVITGPRVSVTITDAHGNTTDALGYVDVVYSQWVRLAPGANHLTYSSEDDIKTTMIEIGWRNWYSGVG